MADETPLTHREAEALTLSIRDLTQSIDTLRGEMAATYVRKDVYEAEKREAEAKERELKSDVDKHAAMWDWLIKLVLGVVILALLTLVVTQGGQP